MQNLEPVAMGALCMAFHKLAQRQLPGRARRRRAAAAPAQLRSAKPYAERLFEYFPLGGCRRGRALGARDAGDADRRLLRGRRRRADPRGGGRLPVLHPGVRPRRLGGGRRLADHARGGGRGAAGRAGDPRRGVLRQPRRAGDERGAPLHGGDGRPRRRAAGDGRGDRARRLQQADLVGQGPPGADPQGADLRPGVRDGRLHRAALRRVHAPALPAPGPPRDARTGDE